MTKVKVDASSKCAPGSQGLNASPALRALPSGISEDIHRERYGGGVAHLTDHILIGLEGCFSYRVTRFPILKKCRNPRCGAVRMEPIRPEGEDCRRAESNPICFTAGRPRPVSSAPSPSVICLRQERSLHLQCPGSFQHAPVAFGKQGLQQRRFQNSFPKH